MNNYRRFSPTQIVLLVCIVGILGVFSLFAYSLSHHGPLFELIDSGTSAIGGWDLQVNANGSGTLACDKGATNPCKSTNYKSSTFPAISMKKELATTNLLSYKDYCTPSTSTSTDTLIYKKVTIKGIDCYMLTQNTPLAGNLKTIFTIVYK